MAFIENKLPEPTFLVLTNLECLKTCMFYHRKDLYPGDAKWGASDWKVRHFFNVSTLIPTKNKRSKEFLSLCLYG